MPKVGEENRKATTKSPKVRWQVEDHHERLLTGKLFVGDIVVGELMIEKQSLSAVSVLRQLRIVIDT